MLTSIWYCFWCLCTINSRGRQQKRQKVLTSSSNAQALKINHVERKWHGYIFGLLMLIKEAWGPFLRLWLLSTIQLLPPLFIKKRSKLWHTYVLRAMCFSSSDMILGMIPEPLTRVHNQKVVHQFRQNILVWFSVKYITILSTHCQISEMDMPFCFLFSFFSLFGIKVRHGYDFRPGKDIHIPRKPKWITIHS